MKKSILALGTALMLWHGSVMPMQAADTAVVTFTEDDTLEYENVEEDGNYVNFGSVFEGVAAGETRTQTILIQNENEKTADFYMRAEVVKGLETGTDTAKGAGYEMKLMAGENVLYDSMLGGYGTDKSASTSGIEKMNEVLEDDIFIATLKSGESMQVTLSITFDGEAMDNTTDVDYSWTNGQLVFEFKAGYEDPTGISTVYKTVTKTSQTNYIKELIKIFEDSSLLTPVKTGDTSMIGLAVAVLVAGILFVIFGKRKKDGVLMLLIVGMCIPSVNVLAAPAYTVTFRPGNAGYFAISSNPDGDRQVMAQEVAERTYSNYAYEVTKNGAIKVTVPANESVPDAPTYIQANAGYFVKDVSEWGPVKGQIVDKNMDFVADYGKLIEGTEYIVKYVDSSSGESIAPIYITQANIGESKTQTAPKEIVISEGTVYFLESQETIQKVLEADAQKNVFVFSYTMQSRETVEEEVITYVDGGTVTITETVTIPIENQTGATSIVEGQEQNANQENTISENVDEDENENEVEAENEDRNEQENEDTDEVSYLEETEEIDAVVDEENEEGETMEQAVGVAAGVTAGVFGTSGLTAGILWLRSKRKNKGKKIE